MFGFPWDCAQPEQSDRINLPCYYHGLGNYKDEFNMGLVVSWVLILCGKLTYTLIYFEHFLWANKNKRCQSPKKSCHAVCHLWLQTPHPGKNATVRHWRGSSFTAKVSRKALKRSVCRSFKVPPYLIGSALTQRNVTENTSTILKAPQRSICHWYLSSGVFYWAE